MVRHPHCHKAGPPPDAVVSPIGRPSPTEGPTLCKPRPCRAARLLPSQCKRRWDGGLLGCCPRKTHLLPPAVIVVGPGVLRIVPEGKLPVAVDFDDTFAETFYDNGGILRSFWRRGWAKNSARSHHCH